MSPALPGRVTSIDFFRGITMFLLAGEATELYGQLEKSDMGWGEATLIFSSVP